jgi:hypothetical protein
MLLAYPTTLLAYPAMLFEPVPKTGEPGIMNFLSTDRFFVEKPDAPKLAVGFFIGLGLGQVFLQENILFIEAPFTASPYIKYHRQFIPDRFVEPVR